MDELSEKIKRLSRTLYDTKLIENIDIYANSLKNLSNVTYESHKYMRKYTNDVWRMVYTQERTVESLNSFLNTLNKVNTTLTDFAEFDKNSAVKSDNKLNNVVDTENKKTEALIKPSSNLDSAPDIGGLASSFAPLNETFEKMLDTQEKTLKVITVLKNDNKKALEKASIDKLINKKDVKQKPITKLEYNKAKVGLMGSYKDLGMEIAKGIKGTLGALLNPIAIVTAFIFKFAPYILLLVAFIKGAFDALPQEIQEKVEFWFKFLSGGIVSVFVAWKGLLPAIISGVSTVIKVLTIKNRIQEHKAIMALYRKMALDEKIEHTGAMTNVGTQKAMTATEHTASMGSILYQKALSFMRHTLELASIIFKRGLELIRHIAEIVFTTFKYTLTLIRHIIKLIYEAIKLAFDIMASMMKVALAAIAVLTIIALVGLMFVGMILIMAQMKGSITEAIDIIIEQFSKIGNEIKEMVNAIIDPITQVLSGLMIEMRKLFYDVKYGDEQSLKNNSSNIKTDKTEKSKKQKDISTPIVDKNYNGLETIVNRIVEPLNIIKDNIISMIGIMTSNSNLTTPTVVTGVNNNISSVSKINNMATSLDNTDTNLIRKNNKNSEELGNEPYEGFKKDIKALSKDLSELISILKPNKVWSPVQKTV